VYVTYRKLIDNGTCPASNHLTATIRRVGGNRKQDVMQIHILEDAGQELAAIDNPSLRRELQIRRAQALRPIERLYLFAQWTLDETARDLINPAGQRVDLTSSEYDLLMAFLRQPGEPLSRGALLSVLRGREWTYFDRSIDTMVARLRKKLVDGSDRPPLIRSVRGVGYVFCAAVSRLGDQDQSLAAPRLAPGAGAGRHLSP
jgi:DNA-binding response OmpR family regulator